MSVTEAVEGLNPLLGEGPHWQESLQSLLCVDSKAHSVQRWHSVTGEVQTVALDNDVGFVVPREVGGYVVGVGKGLRLLDWDSQKTTVIAEFDQDTDTRSNDGKCDPSGRLWAGTMGMDRVALQLEHCTSALYSLDKQRQLRRHVTGLSISNGLAWTSDTRTMFHIDSVPRQVYAFDYDIDSGTPTNRRVAVDFSQYPLESHGYPDGMCIDLEGKLWVACYDGARICRVDPETGAILRAIKFPAPLISSCCFGGPNYDDLYVTCIAAFALNEADMAKYPLSTAVFKVTGLGVRGSPAAEYAG